MIVHCFLLCLFNIIFILVKFLFNIIFYTFLSNLFRLCSILLIYNRFYLTLSSFEARLDILLKLIILNSLLVFLFAVIYVNIHIQSNANIEAEIINKNVTY